MSTSPRRPPPPRPLAPRARAACLAVALALLGGDARAQDARPRPLPPPPPDLATVPIADVPTWVCVPVSADRSLVVGLPARFWIQCPRHSAIPTSLDGDGTVLQYMNARGGSHSLLYVGAVRLPEPLAPEPLESRVAKAAQDFATDLRAKYARVDFALKDDRVAVEKTTVVLSGKKQVAWRTSRYVTLPAVPVSGPDPVFAGEAVMFGVEGTETMVYLALTSKRGGTALDRVLGDLRVAPTATLATLPRVVQLNDVALAQDERYPVRLLSYASPTGFAPTLDVVRLAAELVYAEDRVDAAGSVTGTLRFDQRDAEPGQSLAQESARERALLSWGDPTPPVEVPLATPGAKAARIRFAGSVGGRAYVAQRAVVPLDDKVLQVTWATFGDEALLAADVAAFEKMLRSLQIAIRSSRD